MRDADKPLGEGIMDFTREPCAFFENQGKPAVDLPQPKLMKAPGEADQKDAAEQQEPPGLIKAGQHFESELAFARAASRKRRLEHETIAPVRQRIVIDQPAADRGNPI